MTRIAPMTETLEVKNMYRSTPDKVMRYWEALERVDNLKYRLSDIPGATRKDVIKVMRRHGEHMYVVTAPDDNIVAEFALDTFTGRAAQVHFSMHPDNSLKENLRITRFGLNTILSRWKNPKDPLEPYLDTLIGLTPVLNRRATIFIQKAGMRKLAIIENACTYINTVCDGLLTTLTREDISYG